MAISYKLLGHDKKPFEKLTIQKKNKAIKALNKFCLYGQG
jgi:hypothetical protein